MASTTTSSRAASNFVVSECGTEEEFALAKQVVLAAFLDYKLFLWAGKELEDPKQFVPFVNSAIEVICRQSGCILICRDMDDGGKVVGAANVCFQAAYSKSKPLAAMQFAFRTAVLLSGMVRILSQAPFSFVKQTPRDKKSVARLQALDKLEQVRHEFAGHEECVHLIELACLPAAQGRGVGSALLRHICNLADERGQVAWLETDEPHLPAYYGKFGFNVVKEYVVAEGTEDEFVPNFGMRREARARKG